MDQGNDDADWDRWMASYICLWCICCLARQSRPIIQADLVTCVLGLWYPVCVLCVLFSTNPLISGTCTSGHWGIAVNCHSYADLNVFTTPSVPCGLRCSQQTRRPHSNGMQANKNGWRLRSSLFYPSWCVCLIAFAVLHSATLQFQWCSTS